VNTARARGPNWSAAMKITRTVNTVLAYPPTRSLPFLFTMISSVWMVASLSELYCTVPNFERQVGASTTPREMTLKEFLNSGEGTEYVKLTNFVWCREYGRGIPYKSRRPVFCILIVPREDAAVTEPKPSMVSLIVLISDEHDDISAIRKLTEVHGLIEDFQGLNYGDEELILAAYPNTDRKRCRILRYGAWRVPVTAEFVETRKTEARIHLLISSIFTTIGMYFFIRLCRRHRRTRPSTAALSTS
jgi:hypothetical protein